jgi:uridine kinase
MDADFGILPMPKYDFGQESYYHTVNSNTCNTIEIPNSSAIDTDFVGTIIEAMSAESTYTLKEAYYEVNLGTKITRDEESKEMLDIIFSTRVYDTGEIYNWGGVADAVRSVMQQKKSDFTSLIDSYTEKVNTQMDKFIETFKNIS